MKQHRIHTYIDSDRTKHDYCQICGQEEPFLLLGTNCPGETALVAGLKRNDPKFNRYFTKIFGSKD